MSTIVVTGGSGKLGRVAVRHLMDHGYNVVSIDLTTPPGISNPPKPTDPVFSRVDITDFGQVMGALSGLNDRVTGTVDGIVHLGAIAAPGLAADNAIFETNTLSTYYIFEAARRLEIRNVVWASSETVYGIPYPNGPAYVPVDEEIERPQSSYSLSKLMGEKMAEQYARWDPETKIVGLRFSNVQEPQDYANFAELPGRRAARGTSTSGPISTRATGRRPSASRSKPSSRARMCSASPIPIR